MVGLVPKFNVRRLMAIVALIALAFAIARPFVLDWAGLIDGTVHAPGYEEERFRRIRIGMPVVEVEALMGLPPMRWHRTHRIEVWAYTDRAHPRANYHRRWVYIEAGKVQSIDSQFCTDRTSSDPKPAARSRPAGWLGQGA